MEELLRETRSVCPVCLRNVPAQLLRRPDGRVKMAKTCPEHGDFQEIIWQGKADFAAWSAENAPLSPGAGECCPGSCGLCGEHASASCCVRIDAMRR